MSSSKIIDKLSDFAAGVNLSEAQNTVTFPSHTHCLRIYSLLILIHREGGELNQREGQCCTEPL
jgi:hypothetical protein